MPEQTHANPADWKTFEEIADGIDLNRLPASDALDGVTLEILEGEHSTTLELADGQATWRDANGTEGADPYEAVEVAPDTFFVNVWRRSQSERETLTVIVNQATRRTLSILTTMREHEVPGEPQVIQAFAAGVLDGGLASGPEPEETRDLLGRRVLNDYSPNHLYEHVYVNSQRYYWHCLSGAQKGQGDCDLASYWRFAENQYLFAFREFRIPVGAVIFFNYDSMRQTGRFLGIESNGEIENGAVGAFFQVLSDTDYPDGVEPI